MDVYKIQKAYPDILKGDEIEIVSDNLLYSELGQTHSGVQCSNLDNYDQIHLLCCKVAKLMKEIDKLNKCQ